VARPRAGRGPPGGGLGVNPASWSVPRPLIFHCSTYSRKPGLPASRGLSQHIPAAASYSHARMLTCLFPLLVHWQGSFVSCASSMVVAQQVCPRRDYERPSCTAGDACVPWDDVHAEVQLEWPVVKGCCIASWEAPAVLCCAGGSCMWAEQCSTNMPRVRSAELC
jgi:hypothetical protein